LLAKPRRAFVDDLQNDFICFGNRAHGPQKEAAVFTQKHGSLASPRARGVVSIAVVLTIATLATFAPPTTAVGEPIVAQLQPVQGEDLLRDPVSYTIAEIIDAGGIIIGDKLFDQFSVVTTKSQNAIAPGIGEIAVTPIQVLKPGAMMGGDYGMKFNGPWSAPAGQLADSTIEFRASILPEYVDMGYAFKDNALWLTAFGVSNNTDAGAVSVSENLYHDHPSQGGAPFVNKFAYYINPSDNDLRDEQDFEPVTEMWVLKDVVAYGGTGTVGTVHLSEFYQTFSQVPEPGTFGLLAIAGIMGLIGFGRRR
jgi:hypothetical protein